MKKFKIALFALIIVRILLSIIISPAVGAYGAYAEAAILVIFTAGCAFVCYKLRDVVAEGDTPTMIAQLSTTVTFSGLLLLSHPFGYLLGALLPVLTYRTNILSRLEDSFAVIYLFIPLAIALLFASVAVVKMCSMSLAFKQILFGGVIFALISMSVQNFIYDFVFGCFIYTFLIRYGSVIVCGVYITIYKLFWMILEFVKYEFIGDSATNIFAEIPNVLGMVFLFGSVLLIGIYLDLRFDVYKRKMPMLTAFAIPASAVMGISGYYILNYFGR